MNNITMKKFEQDKEIIKNLPPFTLEEYKEVREDVIDYFAERQDVNNFMLLSNEINYFTIFQRSNPLVANTGFADKFLTFLSHDSFLQSLGKLKVLKRTRGELEIWIGETPFVLFDSDSFFVKV